MSGLRSTEICGGLGDQTKKKGGARKAEESFNCEFIVNFQSRRKDKEGVEYIHYHPRYFPLSSLPIPHPHYYMPPIHLHELFHSLLAG